MQKIFKNSVKKVATFVILEPDTIDRNGDIITADEILKTAHNFFIYKDDKKINVNHEANTDRLDVIYVGSLVAPADIVLGDGDIIKAGSWLVEMKFLSDEIWSKVVDGTITGVSMEGWAMCDGE